MPVVGPLSSIQPPPPGSVKLPASQSRPQVSKYPLGCPVIVMVAAHNHELETTKCIQAMAQTTITNPPSSDLILVDDCSPEVNFPSLFTPPIQVIRHETNQGSYGASLNLAFEPLKGNLLPGVLDELIIIFSNSDITAQPGWIEPLVRAFDNPEVGVVGPKLLFENGLIQSCGGLFDGNLGPFHRYLGWRADYKLANRGPEKVSWSTGAVFATRAKLFDSLGGFDEGYRGGYFEDVDYCLRARTLGFETWYVPGSVLLHTVGQQGGSPFFRENSIRFHKRWDAHNTKDVEGIMVSY